jgi:hypothetical protein
MIGVGGGIVIEVLLCGRWWICPRFGYVVVVIDTIIFIQSCVLQENNETFIYVCSYFVMPRFWSLFDSDEFIKYANFLIICNDVWIHKIYCPTQTDVVGVNCLHCTKGFWNDTVDRSEVNQLVFIRCFETANLINLMFEWGSRYHDPRAPSACVVE